MSLLKLSYLKRQFKILENLEKQGTQQYVTGQELSRLCDVSVKTIRHDIHELNDYFYGKAQILSKQGQGYYLIKNSLDYDSEKEKYFQQEQLFDNSIDRSFYIMKQLLLSQHPIRIEEFSEQMYIDRTSVSRDMKYVRDYLQKFHLMVEYKVGVGNYIVGDELHKRLCMEDIFNQYALSQIVPHYPYLKIKISSILDHDGISMVDSSLDDLIKYLEIMMMRMEEGHYVRMSNEEKETLSHEYEYQVAKDIADYLKNEDMCVMNEEEICFLTVHIIGKRINYISDIESCLVDVLPERIEQLMNDLFCFLNDLYGIDFSNDFYLKKALGVHILAMENRMRFDTYLKNPMLKMIKKNYVLAYLISVDIWLFLHPELNVVYSEDEIAYFTIHIQYSLMRNHFQRKKSVLLVNNLNSSSTELLSYELLQEFNEYMEITDSIHIRELSEMNIKHYDLIISTASITSQNIPVIQIAPILDQTSIHKIRTFFTEIGYRSLADFLVIENIFIKAKFESKQDILRFISNTFQIDYNHFQLKEDVGNMAMEGHIAVPQMIADINNIQELLITLDKPIVWDQEFVQCILFILWPKQFFFKYQELYNLLQKLVNDSDAIEKIISLDDEIQIIHFLKSYH